MGSYTEQQPKSILQGVAGAPRSSVFIHTPLKVILVARGAQVPQETNPRATKASPTSLPS